MNNLLLRLTQATLFLAFLAQGTANAQTVADPKLDESLRETVARGCTGPQSVIIRTQAGYRGGLRNSLTEHGDTVTGEFASLDAVAAEIHCDDLAALASFSAIKSVSRNAPVGVQFVETAVAEAQAAVAAAEPRRSPGC